MLTSANTESVIVDKLVPKYVFIQNNYTTRVQRVVTTYNICVVYVMYVDAHVGKDLSSLHYDNIPVSYYKPLFINCMKRQSTLRTLLYHYRIQPMYMRYKCSE